MSYLYAILRAHYLFQVHMEAERKSMLLQGDAAAVAILPFHEKITYKVGNKVNHDSELICSAESPYFSTYSMNFISFLFLLLLFHF